METTYESIKSLIIEETWNGNQVNLKFKASNQEQAIDTIGVAMPNQEEIMKKMAIEMAKMTASNVAVGSASTALGNLTGISGAGSAIAGAAAGAGVGYQMDPMSLMNVDLTDQVKAETILNAFKGIEPYYVLENNEWKFKGM